MQRAYFHEPPDGLFDFQPLEQVLQHYVRLIDEHLYKLYPNQLTAYKEEMERFREKVIKVAQKFGMQYNRLIDAAQNYATDKTLQERIVAGAKYFKKEMEPQYLALIGDHVLATDNKELKKQLSKAKRRTEYYFPAERRPFGLRHRERLPYSRLFKAESGIVYRRTGYFRKRRFEAERYAGDCGEKYTRTEKARGKGRCHSKISDVLHPELYDRLVEWRNSEAFRMGVPVYTVIQQKAILGISNLLARRQGDAYPRSLFWEERVGEVRGHYSGDGAHVP